jgi:hypothetical protein
VRYYLGCPNQDGITVNVMMIKTTLSEARLICNVLLSLLKFKGHVQIITSRCRLLTSRQNSNLAFHGDSLATGLYFYAIPAFFCTHSARTTNSSGFRHHFKDETFILAIIARRLQCASPNIFNDESIRELLVLVFLVYHSERS